jgi:CheY-like chemotaxis protein/anti-sigma regulatory factor (Ser/Thr protein kinase)
MKFFFKEGALAETIDEVCRAQRVVAEERGLSLTTEFSGEVPRIAFDGDRISQVLVNLISNAIKFTEKGGIRVSLTVSADQQFAVMTVSDTGPGIKQEDIPKLFQKFQQLDAANRKPGGTGLGLALCREIIEAHGGSVRVESEYGRGSAFIVTLPLRRRWKILIIDDDRIVLEVCEKFLRSDICVTLCASTGKEGLRIAHEEVPDLVILDMRLTDTCGYEVMRLLKSSEKTNRIPVLLMSGYIEEFEKFKKEPHGASAVWISKPFERDEFVPRINEMLGIA